MPRPSWLPDLIDVNGVWEQVLQTLHERFLKDFSGGLSCGEAEVIWDTNILSRDNCCEGFWHLISRTDSKTHERLFDPRRAERLGWAAPLIRHIRDTRVKHWEYLEASGRIRIYLWLEDLDYVVILEKRHRKAVLVTAFYVDGSSKRNDFQRKYTKRIQQTPPARDGVRSPSTHGR